MSHLLSSKTGIPVSRLLRITEQSGSLFVTFHCKDLSSTDETVEPLTGVYEDVPQLTLKLLDRKNTPAKLRANAHATLSFQKKGVY